MEVVRGKKDNNVGEKRKQKVQLSLLFFFIETYFFPFSSYKLMLNNYTALHIEKK